MAHAGTYVPAFTGDVPTINIDKFSDNVFQVAEQREAEVFPMIPVDEDFVGGQDLFIDILQELSGESMTDTSPFTSTPPFRNAADSGANAEYQPSARYQHTQWRYGVWAKRLLIAQEWRLPLVRERNDVKRINDDIDSQYVRKAGYSLARREEKIAYAALGATVVEYQKTTSDALNPGTGTNKTLAGHSDVDGNSSVVEDNGEGLTVEKLRTLKKRLDRREVPKMGRKFWGTTFQADSLLADSKVQSIDTNLVRALVQGEVNHYMGFDFIWSNIPEETATGSGIRKCYAFHIDGLVAGVEEKIFISDDILPDWNHMKQLYMALGLGVVRMDEDFVLQVNCLESN